MYVYAVLLWGRNGFLGVSLWRYCLFLWLWVSLLENFASFTKKYFLKRHH